MTGDIKKSVLIIGAGPAGLTLAYELLSRSDQFDVTVLEKQEIVGGLAQTYNHKGNRIDIGGHRFFSKDQRVMDWWFAQMSLQGAEARDYKQLGITSEVAAGGPDPDKEDVVMLARRRLSRIFWNRKFFDYPLSITRDTISKFGLVDLMQSGLSYVAAKFKTYDMTNLEGFYKSRFGERLYDRFFNAYTHKVRGKWPKDISSARGAQRVKGLNLGKAVRDYFKKMIIGDRQSTKTETSLIGKFYYPKLGPGQMREVVAQRVQGMGGKIIFGADFAGGVIANKSVLPSNKDEAEWVVGKINHVCVIPVTKDGKLLLQLRDMGGNALIAGKMSCFGGNVEEGETIFEGVQREIYEELEMKITRENVRYLGIKKTIIGDMEIHDHMYEITGFDDQQLVLHEGEKIMELTVEEALVHENIADSGKELVEYFVEHRFPVVDLGDGITATRATQADVAQAEALRQAAWVESYGNDAIGITSEMIQKRFASKSEQNIALLSQMIAEGKNILVVKENDKIIGLKYPPRSDKGRWRVGAIYLLKEYTGKGLGAKLMNISLKDVRDKDLYCEVAEYNKNTIQFYERLGFHIEPNEQSQTIEFENGAILKTIVMKKPGGTPIRLVKLTPEKREDLKNIRLEMFKNDADAFGGTYEEALSRDKNHWVQKSQSGEYYALELKGVIIGTARLQHNYKGNNKVVGLMGFYVSPTYRGKGFGKKLLDFIVAEVKKDKSIHTLALLVYNTQVAALSLYEKFGFVRKELVTSVKQNSEGKFPEGRNMELNLHDTQYGTQSLFSVKGISYAKDGQMITVQPDIVVSTAPIKELMTRFDGADEEIVRLSNLLEYRDFITVGILAKKLLVENTSNHKTINNIIPDNRLYIHDKGTTVGRIQVFNNWSPYMVADPDTIWIGLEYFCNKSDDIWNMSDDKMIEFAVKELESMQLLDRADYLDGVVRRMEYTYPCYFGEGYDKFDQIKTYLDSISNLYCVGRNGAHRYNNQDHSMLSSMKLADMLISGTIDRSILRSVNTEEEYHEGGKK